MNLEEKVEKGFLEKLRRKSRGLVVPLAFSLALSSAVCSKKNNPVKSEESKQEVVLTTSKTNEQGRAYFSDDETQERVEVQVVDTNNNPIKASNLDITYADGKNVEALFLQDPSGVYLPSREFFSNNSAAFKALPNEQIRTLKTGKSEEFGGIYVIETFQDENRGKLLVDWKQENDYGWTLHRYLYTMNKEDVIKYTENVSKLCDLFWKGFVYLFGIKEDTKFKPSDLIDLILKSGEISAERWDVYAYSGKNIPDGLDFVPSNIPTLQLNNLE